MPSLRTLPTRVDILRKVRYASRVPLLGLDWYTVYYFDESCFCVLLYLYVFMFSYRVVIMEVVELGISNLLGEFIVRNDCNYLIVHFDVSLMDRLYLI